MRPSGQPTASPLRVTLPSPTDDFNSRLTDDHAAACQPRGGTLHKEASQGLPAYSPSYAFSRLLFELSRATAQNPIVELACGVQVVLVDAAAANANTAQTPGVSRGGDSQTATVTPPG